MPARKALDKLTPADLWREMKPSADEFLRHTQDKHRQLFQNFIKGALEEKMVALPPLAVSGARRAAAATVRLYLLALTLDVTLSVYHRLPCQRSQQDLVPPSLVSRSATASKIISASSGGERAASSTSQRPGSSLASAK